MDTNYCQNNKKNILSITVGRQEMRSFDALLYLSVDEKKPIVTMIQLRVL